jgi:hypothetical protein
MNLIIINNILTDLKTSIMDISNKIAKLNDDMTYLNNNAIELSERIARLNDIGLIYNDPELNDNIEDFSDNVMIMGSNLKKLEVVIEKTSKLLIEYNED